MKFTLAALVLFLPLAQDPPRINLTKTASLKDLLKEITPPGGKINVEKGTDEVKVAIKDALFFEALDAICKAHGNVTYCPRDGWVRPNEDETDLNLVEGAWVDYPASYTGSFKVMALCMQAIRNQNLTSDTECCKVTLLLFGPPSMGIGWSSGGDATWKTTEALDAGGKSVLLEEKKKFRSDDTVIDLDVRTPRGNVREFTVEVQPFDLDKGLKSLKGSVHLVVRDSIEIKVPVKEGTEVALPDGKLVVDRINEHEKIARGEAMWHITVTYKSDKKIKTLEEVFGRQAGYESDNRRESAYLRIPHDGGMSLVVQTSYVAKVPDNLIFHVSKGTKTFDVPFEFKNLVFKKE